MHALHEYELTATGVTRVCPGWVFKLIVLLMLIGSTSVSLWVLWWLVWG